MFSLNSQQIKTLIRKDFLLETRNQYTIYGIVLYVISTTLVVYLAMGQPEENVWNGLFWIVQLFVCINAVAKSFLAESHSRMIYYYSIVGAREFIVAKLLYNAVLMMLMSVLSLLIFIVFLENPFTHIYKFVLITLLGGTGLSLLFTFLAAIAAKAKQQASLMAIMGLPIIIPQLLLLMKISTVAFSSVIQEGFWEMTGLLMLLNGMVIALAIILFPHLWKD
ncbi:MAG: heme exporter protein CcmB [Chitinophagaceae bacterium]|nr:heme exporter protein CcmB [Chitinophagaceae bacterium]